MHKRREQTAKTRKKQANTTNKQEYVKQLNTINNRKEIKGEVLIKS